MDPMRRKDTLFLICLCLAEAVLFWRTAPVFFDGDAFFYISYPAVGGAGAIETLTSVDVSRVYRPLGILLFSFVFRPLFELNHSLYAATALFAHLVNTVLVFLVLERLLKDRLAVRAGTVFWGLNPVAIYVTHSFSFLADFSYAFFCLVALLAFFRHTRTGSRRAFLLTVLAYLLALLSKELAITLPPLLVLITLGFLREDREGGFREDAAQRLVKTLFLMLVAYLAYYAYLKGGRFYDTEAKLNYFPRFTLASLLAKAENFAGALYMPLVEKSAESLTVWPQRLVYLGAPAVFLFLVFLAWPPAPLAERVRSGILWALIVCAPVLFLDPYEFNHNLYLPALGLALAFGLFWRHVTNFVAETRWVRPAHLHLYGLGMALLSLHVNQESFLKNNWRPHWERTARLWVEDTKRLFPVLRPPTQLYVLKSNESEQWNLYGGDVLRVSYGEPDLTIEFDDTRDPFPLEAARQGKARVLIMLDGHVHDVTADRLRQAELAGGTGTGTGTGTASLVERLDHAQVSLTSGLPVEQTRFETPTGTPAFIGSVVAGGGYRQALMMLGGTRVRFPVRVTGSGQLSFGVTKRFEKGDGVVARVYFEGLGSRRLLFEQRLNPKDVPADRRWFDQTIDLTTFQGQSGTLELECAPGPRGDFEADWLAWSGLRLEAAHLR